MTPNQVPSHRPPPAGIAGAAAIIAIALAAPSATAQTPSQPPDLSPLEGRTRVSYEYRLPEGHPATEAMRQAILDAATRQRDNQGGDLYIRYSTLRGGVFPHDGARPLPPRDALPEQGVSGDRFSASVCGNRRQQRWDFVWSDGTTPGWRLIGYHNHRVKRCEPGWEANP
ncbi:hypothetical protein [Marilutibacter maris]|uniref:Uncharacterized protein n=1 Tax=Marilutibacter maris TaxID=1605891 RepID=A0A508AZY1_9GAMM|nr:hypothetical protein [Lysobacter maris]KAB8198422.1 hypothetical protein FKV24_002230 [Lysobacter maris]